jgi:hypothetical protein
MFDLQPPWPRAPKEADLTDRGAGLRQDELGRGAGVQIDKAAGRF